MPFDPQDEAEASQGAREDAIEDAGDTYPDPFPGLVTADTGGTPRQSNAEAEEEQRTLSVAALVVLFVGPFFWNEQRRRFIDANGRVVSGVALERIMAEGLSVEAAHGRALANALQLPGPETRRRLIQIARDRAGMRNLILQLAGRTTLPVELPRGLPGAPNPLDFFEQYMLRRIRSIHLNNAAIAGGGLSNLSDDALEQVVRGFSGVVPDGVDTGLRFHMQRFERMMEEIRSGEQPLDGTFVRRATMYTDAGKQTFDAVNRIEKQREGFTECRNVTTARESCGECPALEERGFVPLQEMPPIGTRECLTNCKCYLVFRNPATGVTRR